MGRAITACWQRSGSAPLPANPIRPLRLSRPARPGVGSSSNDQLPGVILTEDEAVHRLLDLLTDVGFAPEQQSSVSGSEIGLRNCPFLELVETPSRSRSSADSTSD